MNRILKKYLKLNKSYSITAIAATILLIVLIVQMVVVVINLFIFQVGKSLENTVYSNLVTKTDDKAKIIERTLVNSWSNYQYMEQVKETVNYMYKQNEKYNRAVQVDETLVKNMIDMSDAMKASGSFALIGPNLGKDKKVDVFEFHDSNVNLKLSDNSDINVDIGSERVARKLNIALDDSWVPNIVSSENKKIMFSNMIKKSLRMLEDGYENNGFWQIQNNPDKEQDVIYYVKPIYDRNTKVLYAIIGVKIDTGLIGSMLNYKDLNNSDKNAYMMINYKSVKNDILDYDMIAIKGPYIKRIIKDEQFSIKRIKNSYYDSSSPLNDAQYAYKIDSTNYKDILAIKSDIRLYGKDNVYGENQWKLLAFVEKKDIEQYSKEIIKIFTLAIIITLIIGMVVVLIMSIAMENWVKNISAEITSIKDNVNIGKDEKTNVKEIDDFIELIRNLSNKLFENSKKFQDIIMQASMPIVAIEQKENEQVVHKLGAISNIFEGIKYNEDMYEDLTLEEFESLNKILFEKAILIDSIYDIEKDCQIDIYERMWREKTRYFRVNTKIIDEDEEAKKREIITGENINLESRKIMQVITDHTRDMTEKLKIQRERNIDILTGLLNRLSFKEKVEAFLTGDKYILKKAAMVMWDLDDLKYVNDTYGHDFGDKYLKAAADVIATIGEGDDIVARLSGDEFFAFLEYDGEDSVIMDRVIALRERLMDSRLQVSDDVYVKLRATTGVCFYPKDAITYPELHKFSDFAMYTAKLSDKGTIATFDRDIYNKDYILLSGKEDLNKFIEERQVKFAFQPIVDANTGEVLAYEGLMRPNTGNIDNVGDVLRLAKKQFKLNDIERLTFEGILEFVDENIELFENKKIFVNSIASAVLNDEALKKMENYAHILGKMVVEIIESEEINMNYLRIKKHIIKKYNCETAIDDFGVGYATESRILEVEPDYIKIDMELIRGIDKDKSRQAIVRNIIEFAKSQKIKVICEGVETYDELDALIHMNVDYVQGYYLAKPNFEIKDISLERKKDIQMINILKNEKIE